jgi:(R,R)-butanediol dehydrogenase/meso-butanediol dehydrogenase/diacetyl reductase
MRAVSLEGKRKFAVIETPKPVSDGKKVIIKVAATGICGTELSIWKEGEPLGAIPGHEFCGVIEDPGALAGVMHKGERVSAMELDPCNQCSVCLGGNGHMCPGMMSTLMGWLTPGSYADYIAVRPDMVRKLPDTINDVEGALIEPGAVAMHAIRLGNTLPGDRVLITGAGAIGIFTAACARMAGASYIAATELKKHRGELAQAMGDIDEVFDANDPDLVAKITEGSKGGVDVVIEATGVPQALQTACMAARPAATIVQVGGATPLISAPTFAVLSKELRIIGAWTFTAAEYDITMDLVARKSLKLERFVTSRTNFNGVQKAYETLTSDDCREIKIIINP